ncbi:MAG: tRNA preQ1(34) S-adenosylmethionine ribosyltransferase-isomerase QueA [Ruminococcaceae bacterium]|nr:tRNA preQ1(34) S-adenosylmethionine ribosyltransferase-isomerase QueA [Oscillospiraceae bacterium]
MKTSDFNYYLPKELIAQTPLERRELSRLLCVDKITGKLQHKTFKDIKDLIKPGDCLVLNDSRVIPARLIGTKETGGYAELLLLKDKGNDMWECLAKPGKRLKTCTKIVFSEDLSCEVVSCSDNGNRIVKFKYDGIFLEVLEKLGRVPLPPYIKSELSDKERYQTVYSKQPGSAAAPTAGLHFTKEMLSEISDAGVKTAFVTLHIGLGTFRPVKEDTVEEHIMHSEYCIVSSETARIVNETKNSGGRIICVGTTSCRTVEAFSDENGKLIADSGFTDIYIYPGYKFKCMDALITNFHLPESTLLMLVSAFAGRTNILNAYSEAVKEKYRFFSFGDAMYIGSIA